MRVQKLSPPHPHPSPCQNSLISSARCGDEEHEEASHSGVLGEALGPYITEKGKSRPLEMILVLTENLYNVN